MLFPKLVGKYGDDLVKSATKYGDEASDWAKRVVKKPKLTEHKLLTYDSPAGGNLDSIYDFKEGLPISFEKPWVSYDVDYGDYDAGGGLSQLIPVSKQPIYRTAKNRRRPSTPVNSLKDLIPYLEWRDPLWDGEYVLPF